MNRIVLGLALAAVVSAAHAAPGDAYPAGSPPYYLVAPQTHASMNLREGNTQAVSAFPSGAAPYYLVSKQTYADLHANEAKAQSVNAFPAQSVGAGD